MFKNNTEVTLAQYSGPSTLLLEKINGENGQWWLSALTRFLRMEDPWDVTLWPTWAVIDTGYLNNTKFLKKNCTQGDFDCDEDTIKVFKFLQTTPEYRRIELQISSAKMLGFKQTTTLKEVNERVVQLGFTLMTPEFVFNLHYQFVKRSGLHELAVAMEPVNLGDKSIVFHLNGKKGYKELLSSEVKNSDLDNFYISPSTMIVFAKPW